MTTPESRALQIAKKALEFYSLLRRDLYKQGSMTETLVKMDGGDKAREALKTILTNI